MSKKQSRKKKIKISWSSEEDATSSEEQVVTTVCTSAKKKQHDSNPDRSTEKEKNCASLTVKDVSQNGRQIKKAVYKLAKKTATDPGPGKKEEKCAAKSVVLVPYHERSRSRQERANNSVTTGKAVETGHSKSRKTHSADKIPQKTEKISQKKSDNESSERSPSKFTKKLKRHTLDSAELMEQKHILAKRQCIHEEPPKTGPHSKTSKTRKTSKTSSLSKEFRERERKRKVVTKMCQKHREDLKAKGNLCAEGKSSSAAATDQSFTSAKPTTSDSKSNVLKCASPPKKNITSESHKAANSPCTKQEILLDTPTLPHTYKIPKKTLVPPAGGTVCNNDGTPASSKNNTSGSEPSVSGSLANNTRQGSAPSVDRPTAVTPASPFEEQHESKQTTISEQLPTLNRANTSLCCDQKQVVEEHHSAHSEKRPELKPLKSYGELTCMEIDLPEEGDTDSSSRQTLQQDVILILDTNILLSHLDYIKKIRSHGLGAMGFPVILIPWVVLQELDSLKMGNRLSGSVDRKASPAIKYIHSSIKSRESGLWGQSMQQAAQSGYGLIAENNDDRVLQCCLQYQSLYPESPVILCTNDKNLCSKAILSGVKAFSKDDLVKEVERFRHDEQALQCLLTPTRPLNVSQFQTPVLNKSCTPAQSPKRHSPSHLSQAEMEEDDGQLDEGENEEEKRKKLSICVSDMEDCLREVLCEVLEVEMKAVYENLWLEIVYLKPPWTLPDILQCMKKHWIAVFGHIVPRKKLQAVLHLNNFFTSDKTVEYNTTLEAFLQAKDLLTVFGKRSSRVPAALSLLDNIFNRLLTKGETPVSDAVMSDDEEKQATSSHVSHQDVWALFENVWKNVYEISLTVFKALHFDPQTMQRAQPTGGPPPPQDALCCLYKVTSMVSQLLQAFSRILSAVSLEETQALLNFIHSSEVATTSLTAKDLLDCFSQQEYRDRLSVGGTQLMHLKVALEHCVEAVGQRVTHAT